MNSKVLPYASCTDGFGHRAVREPGRVGVGDDAQVETQAAAGAILDHQPRVGAAKLVEPGVVTAHVPVVNVARPRAVVGVESFADVDVVVDFDPIQSVLADDAVHFRHGPLPDLRLAEIQLVARRSCSGVARRTSGTSRRAA